MSDIAQHIAVSCRVDIEDLDWELARKVGLTQREIETLEFFADIESQTVYYFLEVAKLLQHRGDQLGPDGSSRVEARDRRRCEAA